MTKKCSELSWVCVPMALEAWGQEAKHIFSRLAIRLVVKALVPKSQATAPLHEVMVKPHHVRAGVKVITISFYMVTKFIAKKRSNKNY